MTCLAPDQVQNNLGDISGPENQVNLFLHQVTHNAAWRNVDLPSLAADGKTRLKSPPLALDLHYLLTVYGSEDWQAEALLGYALMMLHENPVLARADIANALTALTTIPEPYPTNPLTPVLGASGLADQIEMLKITPGDSGARGDGVVVDRAKGRLPADLSVPGDGGAAAAAAADEPRPAGAAPPGSMPSRCSRRRSCGCSRPAVRSLRPRPTR